MRIPLLRSLSGSVLGSSERRRSKSRSRALIDTNLTNSSAADTPAQSPKETETDTPVPPVPSIPSISVRHAPKPAMRRKIWVKRAGGSATRVEVPDDDLVDNVRDAILNKYANSLGRTIDSPDIILKILTRDPSTKSLGNERTLGPEESIGSTLDDHFPGGQTIEEALIIDVPKARTPRPSPQPGNHQIQYYVPEQYRPDDAAREYFPPMALHSPHVAHIQGQHGNSMAVLTTGQLPPLPSPGGHSSRRGHRPKYGRQHTSSPTILHSTQPNGAALGTYGEVVSNASSLK